MKKRTARKRVGRPLGAQKTASIHARVRPENLVKLQAMARRAGLTPSAFVDKMIEVHERAEVEAIAAAERAQVAALAKVAA